MEQSARTRIVLHVVETVYALSAAAWIVLPLARAAGFDVVNADWGAEAAAGGAARLAWAAGWLPAWAAACANRPARATCR